MMSWVRGHALQTRTRSGAKRAIVAAVAKAARAVVIDRKLYAARRIARWRMNKLAQCGTLLRELIDCRHRPCDLDVRLKALAALVISARIGHRKEALEHRKLASKTALAATRQASALQWPTQAAATL